MTPEKLAAAIKADDAFLNDLGSAVPAQRDDLGALLLQWQHAAEQQPMPALVDTDTAITLIRGAAA